MQDLVKICVIISAGSEYQNEWAPCSVELKLGLKVSVVQITINSYFPGGQTARNVK